MLVGCQTGAQKQATQQQAALTGTENQIAQFGLKTAGGTIGPAVTGAQSWFSKLLSGDKNAVMGAVAPAVQTLTGEYDTLAKQTKNTLPSGGERDKLLADLPFKKAGDIATLVGGAQEKGAAGLLNVTQLLSGLLTGSTAAAGTGGAIAGNVVSQQQQQQAQQQQAGVGIGALVALLAGI